MIEIPIPSATVPSPLDCVISNANWQSLVSLLQSTFPEDASIFNTGNTEPSPSRRIYPWFRSNADGTPDRWYIYSMGAWISLHPRPTDAIELYLGTEASIDTFDGGEAGAVTSISGPMWEKVDEANARFLVGPGTLPSTAVIGVGDTGGLEEVTLTVPQLPAHSHAVHAFRTDTEGGSDVQRLARTTDETESDVDTFETGDGEAHTNIPPFLGIFVIKRSARLFYRL